MRQLFLIAGLLLPHVLKAQFNSFENGSYVLSNSPNVRHECKLKLLGAYGLAAKDASGQKTTFVPAEISSFRIGQKKFAAVGGFAANLGPSEDKVVSRGFAEQLDSGQVVLLRFIYVISGPTRMNSAGIMSGGNSLPHVLYLLRRSSEQQIVSLPTNWLTGAGEKFRDTLLPYLSSRPDLVKLLSEKRITTSNLAAVVHAINSNQPFLAK